MPNLNSNKSRDTIKAWFDLGKRLALPFSGVRKLIAGLILALIIFPAGVIAAPLYAPGETLDPACAPADADCTVTAPAISGVNSDITGLTALVNASTTNLTVSGEATFGNLTVTGITLGGVYRTVWPSSTGGGDGFWATTTSGVGYADLTGDYAIVIGSSATTSSVKFEVAGATKLGGALTVTGLLAASTSIITNASTSEVTVANKLTAGGLTVSGKSTLGNASTTNLTISTAAYLGSLASTYLAVNQAGQIIATTSPVLTETDPIYAAASGTILRFGTSTDALTEGSSNLFWTNARFDTRLAATTSLSQIATIGSSTGQTTVLGKTVLTNASSTNLTVSDAAYLGSLASTYLAVNQAGQIIATTTPVSGVAWGSITGTLSAQTDLNNALGLKIDISTTSMASLATLSGLSTIGSSTGATNVAGKVGIGSTTPLSTLSVSGTAGTNPFTIASSTGVPMLTVLDNGNLTVTGVANFGSNIASRLSNASQELVVAGGKFIADSSNSDFGQFQVGNSTSNGEASLAFLSGVTQYGTYSNNSSANGNNNIWLIGAATWNTSGSVFNISNKGYYTTSGNVTGNILSITAAGKVGIGSTTPLSTLSVSGTAGTNPFTIASSTGNAMLSVTQAGNVGIGVFAPTEKLSVSGNINVTGSVNLNTNTLLTRWSDADHGNFLRVYDTSDNRAQIALIPNGTPTNSRSRMLFAMTDMVNDPDNYETMYFAARADAGQYWIASETGGTGVLRPIVFKMNSANVLTLATSGNIGIGSTTPSNALEVNGSGYFTGNLWGANLTATGTLTVSGKSTLGNASTTNLTISTAAYLGSLASTYLAVNQAGQIIATTTPVSGVAWGSITGTLSAQTDLNNALGLKIDISTTSMASLATLSGLSTIGSSTGATNVAGKLGIGSTTPLSTLSVSGTAGTNPFTIASSTGNAMFTVNQAGNVTLSGTIYAPAFSTLDGSQIYIDSTKIQIGSGDGILLKRVDKSFTTATIRTDATSVTGLGGSNTVLSLIAAGVNVLNAASSGSVGIGTTTPWAKLSIQGTYGSTTNLFEIASTTSAAFATSSLFVVTKDGYIGVSSSSPNSLFTIHSTLGNTTPLFTVASTSGGTTTIALKIDADGSLDIGEGNLTYDASTGITSMNSLSIGNFNFEDDAGAVSWIDMGITASSSAGTILSYTAQLGGTPALAIYGVADGGTGLSTGPLVNIGATTTAPTSVLTVWGTTTAPIAHLLTSGSSTALMVLNNGNVGIGSTTPLSTLAVQGTTGTTPFVVASSTGNPMLTVSQAGGLNVSGALVLGTALSAAYGGTGLAGGYTIGDLLYATGETSLGRLHDAELGYVLVSGGAGVAPSWDKISVSQMYGTFTATSSLLYYDGANINSTSTPVLGNIILTSTTSTTTIEGPFDVGGGNLSFDYETGITTISSLQTGALNFDNDAGVVSWIDMGITASSSAGTILSYTAQLGGTPALAIYGIADGGTGLTTGPLVNIGATTTAPTSVLTVWGTTTAPIAHLLTSGSSTALMVLDSGNVGIGSTTPLSTLSVSGTAGTNPFTIASSSGANMFTVLSNGNVGIGTANPQALLNISSASASWRFGGSDLAYYYGNESAPRIQLVNFGYNTPNHGLLMKWGDSGSFDTAGVSISPYTNSSLMFSTSNGATLTERMIINGAGLVGIGTTTPWAKLSIQNSFGATANLFEIASTTSAAFATSSLFVVTKDGYIGISSSTPTALLTVHSTLGNTTPLFSVASTSGGTTTTAFHIDAYGNTSLGNGFYYDADQGLTSIAGLQTGSLNFEDDAGQVSWADMTTGASSTVNTISSYTANLGGLPVLTIYGVNDGLGGFLSGPFVNIGSSSAPTAMLTVWGTSTQPIARFMSTSSTTLVQIGYDGKVGIGTTTPEANLTASGTIQFSTLGAGTLSTDAYGNVTAGSDARLKDVQGDFTRGLAEILTLDPVLYKWKAGTGLDSHGIYAGFVAQNVQNAIPEAVGVNPAGYLTLSDRPILAALVNAVKEQQLQIANISGSLSTTTPTFATSTDSFAATLAASLGSALDYLSAKVTSGVSIAKEIVVEKITALVGNFGKVRVEEGIEMKDAATGETYCVVIKNGEFVKEKGECGAEAADESAGPVGDSGTSDGAATTTDSSAVASTTPPAATSTAPVTPPAETATTTPTTPSAPAAPAGTEADTDAPASTEPTTSTAPEPTLSSPATEPASETPAAPAAASETSAPSESTPAENPPASTPAGN